MPPPMLPEGWQEPSQDGAKPCWSLGIRRLDELREPPPGLIFTQGAGIKAHLPVALFEPAPAKRDPQAAALEQAIKFLRERFS